MTAQKIMTRESFGSDKRRIVRCSNCDEMTTMISLRCEHCGQVFEDGWRDETGDRGRETDAK